MSIFDRKNDSSESIDIKNIKEIDENVKCKQYDFYLENDVDVE